MEFDSILRAFDHLPTHWETDPRRRKERQRERDVAKRRLAELCARSAAIASQVATNIALMTGVEGDPHSWRGLHDLLERQVYRLAFWRVAADEINYRRFFGINDLAALRTQEPKVFEATHRRVIDWARAGRVGGFRIDHIDGLHDPAQYCRRLHAALSDAAPDDEPRLGRYVVVEKILASHEHLRQDWAVHGTTGYDFAQTVTGLLVWPSGQKPLERLARGLEAAPLEFDEQLYRCKRLIIDMHLSSELSMLANLLDRIAEADWQTRDYTLNSLREALAEIVACFPVYRTYVTSGAVSEEDRRHVDWAVAWANKRRPAAGDIFDFIASVLLLERAVGEDSDYAHRCFEFACKFQQYTAPVMAKGLEDTCFYRDVRLLSLNDVGGDPRRFGVSLSAFHHTNQERVHRWSHAMLAGSTHDSKRSEDVRARLNVLSELPETWRQQVIRWRRMNRRKRRKLGSDFVPSPRDEYLFYQSAVGACPLGSLDAAGLAAFRERLDAYLIKAVREAKQYSSWMAPDEAYERGLGEFVQAVLEAPDAPFAADLLQFARCIGHFGLLNSLTQTLLRFSCPGVPDLYQGDELFQFHLVDPDNRRPVDYALRTRLLSELQVEYGKGKVETVRSLLDTMPDGRVKLFLIWRALQARREHRQLFQLGDYRPLETNGPHAEHICAFQRRHAADTLLSVTGRWYARLLGGRTELPLGEPVWQETNVRLPQSGRFRNLLTGKTLVSSGNPATLRAAELFAELPVALLLAERACA